MNRALSGEVDGKLYIAVHAIPFITRRVHGRFYGFDLKRKWLSRKTRHRLVNAEENAADLKAQGKKPGFTPGLLD